MTKYLNVVADNLPIGSATRNGSKVILANNCGDIRLFEAQLLECIKAKANLPPELADIFELTYITRADGSHYGVINWA